ncbi:MAG: orotidine-5'-phosphate decarboxylase [Verrucomicrobiota bacterium]
MNTNTPQDQIIVALDFPTDHEALTLVDRLGDAVRFYKIGLQLFTKCGPSIVERIKATGAKVFLDLKFHDIPNTVKHSVTSGCGLGADMMTIHLTGGSKMIRAAADGLGGSQALILGVTVLTSSNRETLREVAIESEVADQVLRLAKLGVDNGLRGVVASPLEIALLRQSLGDQLTIVTPGVRPAWAEANDQQRTMTPGEAVRAGANYLVIGRPITAHADPAEAAKKIIDEIAG